MIRIDEHHFQWVYPATVLAGLLFALFMPGSAARVPPTARPKYLLLQVLTLTGAVIGAKLSFLWGDLGWPVSPLPLAEIMQSGRSITGGLIGGFLTAEVAKIPLRYTELPNDWFAVKLPLSIAIGRVGCVLAGCCRGIPGSYPLSMVYSDGLPRFPAQLCELAFQLVAFGTAYVIFKHSALRGRIFAMYMIAYGIFRVGIEALRDTRKLDIGVSAYQLLSVALFACGVVSFAWYSRRERELLR